MNNTGETSKIISGMQRTNSRMICNMIYYSIKLKKKMGLPRWRSVKVLNWQCRRCKRREFYPLQLGRSPWRRKWQPTPVFLPEEFHGQRSLAGYIVHGVAKSRTQLSECMCACTRACTHTHTHTKKKTPWLEQYVPKRQLIKFCSHYKTSS